ncbi:hypothetical protein D6B98_08505 [Bradyrhizobium sp. LVM 105]|nr:hypothetical protein D6B98_08505 [Bradyrhizobium sp. LVM 105]
MRAQRSNQDRLRGGSLDCFVASAPRNDDAETRGAPHPPVVPRTQRSAAHLRRGALLSRGPWRVGVRGLWVPALRCNALGTLWLVRDTRDRALTPSRARPSAAVRSRRG